MENKEIELLEQFNILMFNKRFSVLCDAIFATFGIDIQTEKELSWLKRNYMGYDRYYHTITHVIQSLHLYDEIKNNITDGHSRLALQFAIFYHDIIYVPQNGDDFNIKHSVESANDALLKFKEDENQIRFVNLVQKYITSTNHKYLFSHQMIRNNLDRNSAFMSDIDLYNLAIGWEQFQKNNINIRKEYKMFSDDDFNESQIDFFKKLLSLERIFLTSEFRIYENLAQNNINKQLEIFSKNK